MFHLLVILIVRIQLRILIFSGGLCFDGWPDLLQTATSVTTDKIPDQEWMEIDTPDPVEFGMETTGGSRLAVSDISVNTDVLQTAISETRQVSEK